MSFKIGDRVRVIADTDYYGLGYEFEIEKIARNVQGDVLYMPDKITNYGVREKFLELVFSRADVEYHVGDRVKIKNNLIKDKFYGECPFINKMADYPVVTIRRISRDFRVNSECYYVKENNYAYAKEMFEGLANPETDVKYRTGDKVKIKDGLKVGEKYGTQTFIDPMKEYQTVTIASVGRRNYWVKENNCAYTREMFEGLAEEPTYKQNIIALMDKQMNKGLNKYGELLENNTTLSRNQRIEHLQEELIDGLQYCEHLKAVDDSLTGNDYQRMALRTATTYGEEIHELIASIKTGYDDKVEEIIKSWKLKAKMLDGATGLAGEGGEVNDIIKKWVFQGHNLDKEHLAEELGDVLWYIALLSDGLEIPLEEIMKSNTDKLKARYPDGFDKNRSIHREK